MATLEDKKAQYVADLQTWFSDYKVMMERAWTLQNGWAFYQSMPLEETDLPDSIVPGGTGPTKLESLTDAVANMQSIHATFDAGIDDNFERVV